MRIVWRQLGARNLCCIKPSESTASKLMATKVRLQMTVQVGKTLGITRPRPFTVSMMLLVMPSRTAKNSGSYCRGLL